MRRAVIAGLVAGALIASLAGAAVAETKSELKRRCIKQANAELVGTGKSIKRSDFDRIFLGTSGDDVLHGRTSGRDLICGLAGSDQAGEVAKGDVFVGGFGYDKAASVVGGIFVGGYGDEVVDALVSGLVVGGLGSDLVEDQLGGRFYGRAGDDSIYHLRGGKFSGGTGHDGIGTMSGGSFYAGADDDYVDTVDGAKALYGGPGNDRVHELQCQSCTFVAGPGRDRVDYLTGRFDGGDNKDKARWVYKSGFFKGGPGQDAVTRELYGKFVGDSGTDRVQVLVATGKYYGGSGADSLTACRGGTAVSVELGDVPCPRVP